MMHVLIGSNMLMKSVVVSIAACTTKRNRVKIDSVNVEVVSKIRLSTRQSIFFFFKHKQAATK